MYTLDILAEQLHTDESSDDTIWYPDGFRKRAWLVEGHCDPRGTVEYNLDLGRKRAEAVAEYLRAKLKEMYVDHPQIATFSYGEGRLVSKTNFAKDRRAVIIPDGNWVERALDSQPADAYLVDQSGTMEGNWGGVKSYFEKHRNKDGSQVYVFSSERCGGLRLADSIEDLAPIRCRTALWDSACEVISNLEPGQSVTLLTDGLDNDSKRCDARDVENLAIRGKNPVSVIGLGNFDRPQLMHLASVTGGGFYTH